MPYTHGLFKKEDETLIWAYESQIAANKHWNALRTKLNQSQQGAFHVGARGQDNAPPPFYEHVSGNDYRFVAGRPHGDEQHPCDFQLPTVGIEKEVATLQPKIQTPGHGGNKAYREAHYYAARVLKFYVIWQIAQQSHARLLFWAEIEDTGNAGQFRLEFASAVLNTGDPSAVGLFRRALVVLADQVCSREKTWVTLDAFASDATAAFNKDETIKAHLGRFQAPPPSGGNAPKRVGLKLIAASHGAFRCDGPLPIGIVCKQTTKGQLKDTSGAQLNYTVPLLKLGFLPQAWVDAADKLMAALAGPNKKSNLDQLLKKSEYSPQAEWKQSFLRVFLEGTHNAVGGYWFARAQFAARALVDKLVGDYLDAHANVQANLIDRPKLCAVFTVYLVNLAYETSLATDQDTQKDNLGHLIKTPVIDLVRQCTSQTEQELLLWFARRDDFHKTLNAAVDRVSLKARGEGAIAVSGANPFAAINLNGTADDVTRPQCAEQIHDCTFKPGLVQLFYPQEQSGNNAVYSNVRAGTDEETTHALRKACLLATSNAHRPHQAANNVWTVLVEARSKKYTVTALGIPDCSVEDAQTILDAVQQ